MKNKLLFLIVIIGIGFGAGIGLFVSHADSHQKNQVLSVQTAKSANVAVPKKELPPTVPPSSAGPGVPETISIPKINVQTKVESVAMDSQGRMDVPKVADDTAWFSPGFRPGMNGSAVIDGHYDRVTGAPAAFWNLKQLSAGDAIIITDDNGHTYNFAVDHVAKYPYNSFPIKEVFAAGDVPMLNLITCNGVWDKSSDNYSDRLVVYSKLVSQK